MNNYNDVIESFENGQYKQAFSQFESMNLSEKLDFSANIRNDELLSDEEKIKYLYYLFNKLMEKII